MLLHLSDLHFGTEQLACMQAIGQFCAEHDIQAVVVSGDLAQRARLREFYACKQFLDSLNLPYLVVPGNHDIPLYALWRRVFTPFYGYQLFFGSLERDLETEDFYILGVNSIRRRYHTKGHISLEQIERIDQKLQAAPSNKYKILLAHQPFYIPAHQYGQKDCPMLAKIALQRWSQNGLNAILHGHLHQSAVDDLNQVYDLKVKQPILAVQAGTAISHRLHAGRPNSFNTIHLDGQVKHYYFDTVLQCFKQGPPNRANINHLDLKIKK